MCDELVLMASRVVPRVPQLATQCAFVAKIGQSMSSVHFGKGYSSNEQKPTTPGATIEFAVEFAFLGVFILSYTVLP